MRKMDAKTVNKLELRLKKTLNLDLKNIYIYTNKYDSSIKDKKIIEDVNKQCKCQVSRLHIEKQRWIW